MNFNKLILLLCIPMLFLVVACGDDPEPTGTCSDGIENQNETGVDCGGSCDPCITASCTDGIQNQNETDIDCGGDCDPCIAAGKVFANVNNTAWESNGSPSVSFQGSNFNLDAINPSDNSSRIIIMGPTFDEVGAVSNFSILYTPELGSSEIHSSVATESVNKFTITKLDGNLMSGTFEGDVKYADINTGVESVITIRNGQFRNLSY